MLYETLTQIRSNNTAARDSAIVPLEDSQKKRGRGGGAGGGGRRPSPGA